MNHYQNKVDLYCALQSYRAIHENEEKRMQANELYKKTTDLKKVDELCNSFLLKDKAKKLLEHSKINKRFMKSTFEGFNLFNETQIEALDKAKKYAEDIKSHLEDGTNLIIAGYNCVGTGKTHLASSIAKELMMNKGIPCKFINVLSLIAELKETFDITEYIDVEVLIIDDLGKEKGTQWVCEQIYSIINSRYEQMKPIIITTEKDIVSLKNNYDEKGKAIISRLCENFILIKLTGEDHRRKR